MDFSALVPASAGSVELLELSWPPHPGEDGQKACVCYVMMLREEGFLLCLPAHFFEPGDLSAHGTGLGPVDFGPSHSIQAAGVALTESGEWGPALPPASVPALLLDLPASASMLLSPLELDVFEGVFFVDDRPTLYPLASEALSLARQWVADDAEALASGYQTAVSELGPPAADPRPAKRAPKAKRPSVAQIALQTAALTEVVAKISTQLAALQQQAGGPTAPQPEPRVCPGPALPECAKVTCSYIGPPSACASGSRPAAHRPGRPGCPDGGRHYRRRAAKRARARCLGLRHDGTEQGSLSTGGAPSTGRGPSAGFTDFLELRGAQSRQRLQSELAQLSGAFAEKVRAKAAHRMTPAGLSPTEQASLCRYFERYGGFSRMRETGLIVYQAARAFDLLTAEQPRAAADALGLLLVYLDQLALDSGSTTVHHKAFMPKGPRRLEGASKRSPRSPTSLGSRPRWVFSGRWTSSRPAERRQRPRQSLQRNRTFLLLSRLPQRRPRRL